MNHPLDEGAHAREVASGQRFTFGENWARFLRVLDDERIARAEDSLARMLDQRDLGGLRFLDVGCGSGLFSLVARRLGATVHSFDYDPQSAECARELKRRYFPGDDSWTIEEGSILDAAYVRGLGSFDVVYSWGVLHHTGAMWQALENAAIPVTPGGRLFVAIYNDQGGWSNHWRAVKRLYCSSRLGKAAVLGAFVPYFLVQGAAIDLISRKSPLQRYRDHRAERGMSLTRDWVDWLGGYPFEVAKPEAVLEFYQPRGFTLERLYTVGGEMGCNEFVFRKQSERD